MHENIRNRCSFIGLIFWLFLIISAITRTALLIKSIDMIDLSFVELIKIYFIGAFYDFVSVSYLVIPFAIYLLFLPQRFFNHKFHHYITYIFTYVLLFGAVFLAFSEWFFLDEFSVRFNFIAVDYLFYKKYVIC
ncbi:MAG: sulfatase, partial [Sulfurimonas sp.]|nr:sulfatase [Sulfurimonas sp.]